MTVSTSRPSRTERYARSSNSSASCRTNLDPSLRSCSSPARAASPKSRPPGAVEAAVGIGLAESGVGGHLERSRDAADLVPGQLGEALHAEAAGAQRLLAAERQQEGHRAAHRYSRLTLHARDHRADCG